MTTAGSHAFLAFGATAPLKELFTLAEYDAETRRHLSGIGGSAGEHNPVEAAASDDEEEAIQASESASDPGAHLPDAAENEPVEGLDVKTAQALQSLLQHLQPLPSSAMLLLEHRDNRPTLPLVSLPEALATETYPAFEQRECELAYRAPGSTHCLVDSSSSVRAWKLPQHGGSFRENY